MMMSWVGKKELFSNSCAAEHWSSPPDDRHVWEHGLVAVTPVAWNCERRCPADTGCPLARDLSPDPDGIVLFASKVLSDEVKRKQYDAYGTASFDPGAAGAGAGRQYWSTGPSIDPEELFKKIFGEFSGSPFGDFQSVFDQPQEVWSAFIFWVMKWKWENRKSWRGTWVCHRSLWEQA